MNRRILLGLCVGALALAVACSQSSSPVAPAQGTGGDGAAAADGSTLKIDAPALNSPADGFQGGLGDQTPLTLVVNNVKGKYATFEITYQFEVRDASNVVAYTSNVVENKSQGTTERVITSDILKADAQYTWRARGVRGQQFGPWSSTRRFKTAVPAGCFGTTLFDPLSNGTSCGTVRGGQFVSGQGWQSLHTFDVIDYNIPTCGACKLEFDITNIGPQEGLPFLADLKFISMGEGPSMGDFGSFRDNPWKMHFIQRADFPSGLEIVWRNGGTDANGKNPGDHRIKLNDGGPIFRSSEVGHWVITWDKDGYIIAGSQNGGPVIPYLTCGESVNGAGDCNDGGFNGKAYTPPNMRVELGCFPRNESFVGAIYRNIKLTPLQ